MAHNTRSRAACLVVLLTCLATSLAIAAATDDIAESVSLSSAVCPIVYQLDQSPSSRGYHYSFFGNGFFINEQGYLLTAAHVLETFRDGGSPTSWSAAAMAPRFSSKPRLSPGTPNTMSPSFTPIPTHSRPGATSRSCLSLRSPPLPASPFWPSHFIPRSSRTPTHLKSPAKTAFPVKFFLTSPRSWISLLRPPKSSSSAIR